MCVFFWGGRRELVLECVRGVFCFPFRRAGETERTEQKRRGSIQSVPLSLSLSLFFRWRGTCAICAVAMPRRRTKATARPNVPSPTPGTRPRRRRSCTQSAPPPRGPRYRGTKRSIADHQSDASTTSDADADADSDVGSPVNRRCLTAATKKRCVTAVRSLRYPGPAEPVRTLSVCTPLLSGVTLGEFAFHRIQERRRTLLPAVRGDGVFPAA